MLIDEKNDTDHVEKARGLPDASSDPDVHPEQDWTQEEERAIVRKADWRVFPMLCLVSGHHSIHLLD